MPFQCSPLRPHWSSPKPEFIARSTGPRTHFETLLNTTPVGVLVFEPERAGLLYANREAERILGDLLISGGSLRELLDTATYRSAHGGKIPMRDLPVGKVLRSGEVIVAEELIVEAEGRSISVMVNATPILSDDGVLESVVASLQDMTPGRRVGEVARRVSGNGRP